MTAHGKLVKTGFNRDARMGFVELYGWTIVSLAGGVAIGWAWHRLFYGAPN